MREGVVRSLCAAVAAALIAMLAACTTAPTAPIGPRATTPRPAPAPQRDAPGQAVDEVPAPVPLTERPRPELLGGEVPREFQRGTASWYGPRFNGRRTASGERFDMREFTAAHRTLPFGTLVRVHSLVNGRDVDVRITDRGPYAGNRIIDLSRAAAEELGMLGMGFKEVVLLVPESTPEVDVAPPPARKPARKPRRVSPASRR
ncbi:septal ring lytic transglycosylase RlpA family protein [Polaromonas sp. JS666]|uniref:septal ring lytic transglycosylase RlpA family protein n=1 Tax=Polaromonas sp. (strain JS666 / ATCC BAA-500) TaxID=296591 RepID=UPI0008903190|nr:septal ring lytic transglycosylase RlpA family protein [Polaromonas sp. JS666]SDN98269.1 rare lipoprotein A [Polaromonas sp. JS666]